MGSADTSANDDGVSEDPAPLSDAQIEMVKLEIRGPCRWVNYSKPSIDTKIARNTVQTQLLRLEEKGWLLVDRSGKAMRFSARHTRKTTQQAMLRRLLTSAFDDSVPDLMMTLLRDHRLSQSEAAELRRMIDDEMAP